MEVLSLLGGGHKVRKARGNAAEALDAADVFLYRDSSIAPLLDIRRIFKAFMVVLEAMIRHGASLSRSVEGFLLGNLCTLLLQVMSMLLKVWVLVIFIE